MYRVIRYFTDLQDNNYAYRAGDEFPREGMTVSEERLEELSSANNKQRTPLIVLVNSPEVEAEKSVSPEGDTPIEEEKAKTVKKTRKSRKKAE